MVTESDIREVLERARWLSALGSPIAYGETVAISSLDAWQNFCRSRTLRAFNLPEEQLDESAIPEFEWLTEGYGALPFIDAPRGGVVGLYKVALKGLSNINESCWTVVGPTNIKLSVRHAIRMAATPGSTPSQSFWFKVLQLYAEGRWPLGVTKDGAIVVI